MGKMSEKNDLQKRREDLLMSRADLAHRSGISIQTITRIEEGKPCRAQTRKKLFQALGLSWTDDDWSLERNLQQT